VLAHSKGKKKFDFVLKGISDGTVRMANTLYNVSHELVIALDLPSTTQTRQEIVKALMDYVKEHHLIDEQNKMVYHTDGLLEWLMDGKQSTSAFSAIRDLKDHLTEVDDDTVSYSEENEDEEEEEENEEGENEEEEEEEQEDNNKENIVWNRELTVQNEEGQQLVLGCTQVFLHEPIIHVNGFALKKSEFEEFYERVTGYEKKENGMEPCLWMTAWFGTLLVFSLWLSLFNQSLRIGC
jgi:chromatin remodeling complex protein RSC6